MNMRQVVLFALVCLAVGLLLPGSAICEEAPEAVADEEVIESTASKRKVVDSGSQGSWWESKDNRWKKVNRGKWPVEMPAVPEVVVSSQRFRKEYLLASEDVLDIVVYKHAEVTRSVIIRPDGYISMPLLDDVKAAGLSPMELDNKLTNLLSKRLKNPEVTVVVAQMRPSMVYIVGDVKGPTVLPLRDAATALQAVARAGGFTERAAKKSVILIRLGRDQHLTATRIDLQTKGQQAPYMQLANTPLEADDIIFVPRTTLGGFAAYFESHLLPLIGAFNQGLSTYSTIRLIEIVEKDN